MLETTQAPVFDPTVIAPASPQAVMQRGLAGVINRTLVNTTPSPMGGSEVAWGGADDLQRDNYYITEDSEPAKLGSSLGWLLQLDGDNMRNAFLNAPWVKAVMPIRPGKEEAAINWLKGVEGMNGITDTANCQWETHAAASLANIVFFQVYRPEDKGINTCTQ